MYNSWVFVILFISLLFAYFADAIAEARGKAQADSLRKTREETPAKLLVNGQIKTTSSSQLKKGDVFTIAQKIERTGTDMYKLKSGVYITASTKYVEVFER